MNITNSTSDLYFTGELLGIMIAMIFIIIIIVLAIYIYMSLATMAVAKRIKTKNAWMAWVPILNYYLMAKMAKKPWWPILLAIVPFLLIPISIFTIPLIISIISWICIIIFYVYSIIWQYKICEIRKRPGWWAILTIIPILGWIWSLVMWGILAWGKK